MTTMAYIIAGLCVLLAVAGMIWYALMVRGGTDVCSGKDKNGEAEREEREEGSSEALRKEEE